MERSDIPAFPSLNAECTGLDSDGFERWDTEPSGGMTLRDYFAAKAISEIRAMSIRNRLSLGQRVRWAMVRGGR